MNSQRLIVSLTCSAILLCLVNPLFAIDEVILKSSDKSVRGTIEKPTKDSLTVKPKIGKATVVPASDIADIEWEGEPVGLKQSRLHERNGLLDKALEGYLKAVDSNKSPNLLLKTDLEFMVARVSAKLAMADAAKQADAISKLDTFRKKHGTNFRYYETLDLLGRLYLSSKAYDKAAPVFTLLANSSSSVHKMQAKAAGARVKLMQDDPAGALTEFEAVLNMPAKEPLEKLQHQAALLGKATCLQKQKKLAEAVKIFEQVVASTSEDKKDILAEAWLRQGDALRDSGRSKEAVLAYLHVSLLCPSQHNRRAEALYKLNQVFSAIDDPANAAKTSGELLKDYPNSEWTKKLSGS